MSDLAPPSPEDNRGRVGPVARTLGFAGLLPQFAAVWLSWHGRPEFGPGPGHQFAYIYGALILSFVGGMWWGVAMRRTTGQNRLVTIAVMPSLVAFFIAFAFSLYGGTFRIPLFVLGAALILTLPIDRHLFHTGEAPIGWMALRVPLSIGLGVLTILAGLA